MEDKILLCERTFSSCYKIPQLLSSLFFFLRLKQSFQCLTRCLYGSSKYGCIIKAVRGTWNFVWQQATLAQGSASEAHLNKDVNMRRLPELMKDAIEILSAPAGFMLVLERIDCAIILLTERPFLS